MMVKYLSKLVIFHVLAVVLLRSVLGDVFVTKMTKIVIGASNVSVLVEEVIVNFQIHHHLVQLQIKIHLLLILVVAARNNAQMVFG